MRRRVELYYEERATMTVISAPEGGNANQDAYHFAAFDYDFESNTDHATFRQYSPTQSRWMSPDPYDGSYDASNPQSLNRYAYVLNNPLAFHDATGLFCEYFHEDSTELLYETDYNSSAGECGSTGGLWFADGWGSTGGSIDETANGGNGAPSNGQVPVHGAWTYGNHCGAGGMGPDINSTDAACHVHDDCYDAIHLTADQYTSGNLTPAQVQGAAACNQQLCNSALNVNRGSGIPFSQRWAGLKSSSSLALPDQRRHNATDSKQQVEFSPHRLSYASECLQWTSEHLDSPRVLGPREHEAVGVDLSSSGTVALCSGLLLATEVRLRSVYSCPRDSYCPLRKSNAQGQSRRRLVSVFV